MGSQNFCKRCLYSSNHPLGIIFNEAGICSGCLVHEEKNTLDWKDRWSKLEYLVHQYKSKNGRNYDCVVPVTGGNDSYFVVDIVKNKLGLNPLLVTYNKYYNTKLGVDNLANLRIRFDCDILIKNVNPQSIKNITRTTLREFGNIYWHCIAGQTVFPVQIAISHKIPLIIWGAHQGIEQVGMFSHLHEVQMTRRYRKEHDLMGYEADDLVNFFDTLTENDIWQYRYPSDFDLKKVGVVGIYLGNYVRWDPKQQHEDMIKRYKYKPSFFSRTFDTYDHPDCFNYMTLHDILKLSKHGYSKVTDHAVREIRHGRLTRAQALSLVKTYEQQNTLLDRKFCEWLNISYNSLKFIINNKKNTMFWNKTKNNKWSFNGNSRQISCGTRSDNSQITFIKGKPLEELSSSNYITIGRGI